MSYTDSQSSVLGIQLASMGIHGVEAVTDGSFSGARFVGFIVREEATVTFKD